MGNSKYTFDNCTTTDKRGNVFVLVSRDMYNEPCFPGDTLYNECDRDTPQKAAEEMFGKMRHSTKEEADAYDAMLKSKSVEIHPVDRDALLALADEMDGLGLSGFSSGWSSGAVNVGSFARRIRGALGVES